MSIVADDYQILRPCIANPDMRFGVENCLELEVARCLAARPSVQYGTGTLQILLLVLLISFRLKCLCSTYHTSSCDICMVAGGGVV